MSQALVPLTYCEVCEEPIVGPVAARYHPARLCPACLISELGIVEEEPLEVILGPGAADLAGRLTAEGYRVRLR